MPDEALFLRRLRQSDASAVFEAFASNLDMARQGVVTTAEEASAYVARLVDPGYWMTDRARGRGVMSRAAATVAEWALSERGLDRLELGHCVNNLASGVVARRAGFVKEGTQREKFLVDGERRDVDTYGRLKTDPRPAFHALSLTLVER